MKILQLSVLTISFFLSTSCKPNKAEVIGIPKKSESNQGVISKPSSQDLSSYETAYFASGCFWCVEAIFESVKGVKEVISGYSGGVEKNPTYEQVSYAKTSHAEAVAVYYNPKEISFIQLVQVFFGSHDPTSFHRQGPDRGPQYRSIAFYKNDQEKQLIESYIKALEDQKVYNEPIVTEVKAFEKFYPAEDYHQDFERNNPDNSYIRNVSIPRFNRFKANFKDYLKHDNH